MWEEWREVQAGVGRDGVARFVYGRRRQGGGRKGMGGTKVGREEEGGREGGEKKQRVGEAEGEDQEQREQQGKNTAREKATTEHTVEEWAKRCEDGM